LKPVKSFTVFGEPVDVLTNAAMTGGQSATIIQTSPPGGGPPPHAHQCEDETFFVLEGEYEFLRDGKWVPVPASESIHALRGSTHAFRNVGKTTGRMLIFIAPAGLEAYLEEISPLSPSRDMPQLLAISARYGLSMTT
jgi:quercetin dioxygenase-like cupin family protein